MSDTVIRVENLSKEYLIGRPRGSSGDGLRHALQDAVAAPLRKLRSALRTSSSSPLSPAPAQPAAARHAEQSFYALRDVSFEVKRGEVLGIIGRNGAGKSTLLKILSRITEPTSGRIGLKGRVASLLEVGTGFHPELTGRENIYLNGAILGMTRAEVKRKFDEIVDFSGVETFLDTPVKRYSSGMYVRLAFAVAAHLEPEILIVDEVLAVGDAEFQRKCLGKMRDVSGQGRTVVFVSHNANAIEELCSTALWIDSGRIILGGLGVRTTLNSYLNANAQGVSHSRWENSGEEFYNPWFTPVTFAVLSGDGTQTNEAVRNDSDLWVEIVADIDRLDPSLTVGFCIYDAHELVLFWSYHTDSGPETWPKLTVGRCRLRGRLPRRLLNESSYRIELIGGLTNRKWLFEPGKNPPAIRLQIRGGLSDSPLWTGRRPGAIAPVLEWVSNEIV